MALIGKNSKIELNLSQNKLHDEVWKASIKKFSHGSSQYVQINTYGTAKREYNDVASQTLQIELETFKRLISMIDE